MEYIEGGILDNPEMRYDELSNTLLDKERETQQEHFDKLNLPESEMLLTEANSVHFPENNKPTEPTIKLDSSSIKASGKEVATKAKSLYENLREFREKKKREREQNERESRFNFLKKEKYESPTEITHMNEAIEKESSLQTIENLKVPELASYPIKDLKTMETIQESKGETIEDVEEIKEMVNPNVNIQKDVSQKEEDPYVTPESSKQPWFRHSCQILWSNTKELCRIIRESEKAKEAIGLGLTCTRNTNNCQFMI